LVRVLVEVFGCTANVADAEIISGLLIEEDHILVKSPIDAELTVLLTCTVKTPTENRMIKRIKELSRLDASLLVAGCMPKAEKKIVKKAAPRASLMGPNDILNIGEIVEKTVDGERIELLQDKPVERTGLPRVRKNPIIHIAPIASGCLGNCSYCIVKHARGHLSSYNLDSIIDDAKLALSDGCKEIWITAEDTAAYRCGEQRLPDLLKKISNLRGQFYIRVGMMTPNQANEILKELLEAYNSERIFKFLHIPVQSGNNDILKKMRRRYLIDDFQHIVLKFRELIPDLSISTDIICGFPGETERQFEDSLKLIKTVQPDVLNISRFWSRPCTEASEMENKLHGREIKKRSRIMTKLRRSLSYKKCVDWLGWSGKVLIDERLPEGKVIGRNYAYKPIVLKANIERGNFADVKTTEAKPGYLIGDLTKQF